MKRSMSYLSEEESDKESNVLDQMLERIQDKKYPPNNDIAKFKEKAAYDSFYVCLDFDAFFTSVEELYKPHLRTVPMVVSDPTGKVVAGANYKSREYGVRSGMPVFKARHNCLGGCHHPNGSVSLVVIQKERSESKYKEFSDIAMAIFSRYDPKLVQKSIDEAYLNITGYLTERGMNNQEGAIKVTHEIRQKVYDATGLTVSAGIAFNQTLAKICASKNKPRGQYCLEYNREAADAFISDIPVSKIGGVGRVLQEKLNALNIITCGDVMKHTGMVKEYLDREAANYEMLIRVCAGLPTKSDEKQAQEQKKASVQQTFDRTSSREKHEEVIKQLCKTLAREKFKTCSAQTVYVKLQARMGDECTEQRHVCIQTEDELVEVALNLYNKTTLGGTTTLRQISVIINLSKQKSIMDFCMPL